MDDTTMTERFEEEGDDEQFGHVSRSEYPFRMPSTNEMAQDCPDERSLSDMPAPAVLHAALEMSASGGSSLSHWKPTKTPRATPHQEP